MSIVKTTRFSGADWADQLHPIMLIGVGGIGSWLALNLSRIGHELFLVDPDTVDETNVTGGQMYKQNQVGQKKVFAVQALCRELGGTSIITAVDSFFKEEDEVTDICITGLDNMEARKQVYNAWKKHVDSKTTEEERAKCLLLDGRLTLEMFEVICIQGNQPDQMKRYEERFLFDDAETVELDCTTKQSTFGAMGISCAMTATLCNWLTNQKLGVDFREVPFYQRNFFPIFQHTKTEAAHQEVEVETPQPAEVVEVETLPVTEPEVIAKVTAEVTPEATVELATPKVEKPKSVSVNKIKELLYEHKG